MPLLRVSIGSSMHMLSISMSTCMLFLWVSAGESAAASALSKEELEAFAASDNRRMLHVVYRVGDLDKTIQ